MTYSRSLLGNGRAGTPARETGAVLERSDAWQADGAPIHPVPARRPPSALPRWPPDHDITSPTTFRLAALYERSGYELVGRVENFPSGTDVLWYRKALRAPRSPATTTLRVPQAASAAAAS